MIKRIKNHNLKNTTIYLIHTAKTSKINEEGNISICKKAELFFDHLNIGLIYDILSTYVDRLMMSMIPGLLRRCVMMLIINLHI